MHHSLGVLLLVTTLWTQAYMFIAVACMTEEMSSPMVHIGWLLTKCKLDNHWVWDVNQYILLIVWALFRTGTDVLLWWYIIGNLGEVMYGPTFHMVLTVGGLAVLSFILNPFWFSTKFKQFAHRDRKYQRGIAADSNLS